MKKMFLVILGVILSLLAGCSFIRCVKNETNEIREKENTDTQVSIPQEEQPEFFSYDFWTYEEVFNALTNSNTEEFQLIRIVQEERGEVYRKTLSAFANEEIEMYVPQFDGEIMELRNKETFYNICLDSSELHNLPWIWYFGVVDGYDIYVNICDISILDNSQLKEAETYWEVLSIMWPETPNPDNYQEYEDYERIYEKTLCLADNSIVTAMVFEIKDSSRATVMMHLDGKLILLRAEEQLFTEPFWSSFSIAPYRADGIE